MKKQYGVKILIEGIENTIKVIEEKVFEEVIVLVNAVDQEDAETKVKEHYVDDVYENANGNVVTLRLVGILDVFELIDTIEKTSDFVEVYSRYLIVDGTMQADDVIKAFRLDA